MNKLTILVFVVCATIAASLAFPRPANNQVEIITQPKPGEEYVFVQTSGPGARPIARKEKHQEQRPFETSHKLPPSLTYVLNQEDIEENATKKPHKRAAGEGPAPAPAGAIKLDVAQLLAKYKTELKTSTTTPAQPTKSNAGKRKSSGGNKRTKKEAKEESFEVTSPSSVLTTASSEPKKVVDEDVALIASGSEKQRSRIQIKKGPNGQEYEYEYVYYYYDEDEEAKEGKVSNSHDGPARNQVTQKPLSASKVRAEKNSAAVTPEVNEVVPSSSSGKGRTRGRQLGEEETSVGEERLPANTRFPPRSRNLNTTPLPEEETITNKPTTRGRGRGRPSTTEAAAPETDNVSDETQGSRGRTRANVRRPSLELVDNASFNTHSNSAGGGASSPSFPTDLPAGPVRFLGATPNESVDPPETIKTSTAEETEKIEETATSAEVESTTVMSPMDKVALDLYAILQGTQKLSGEDSEASSSDESSSTNVSVEEEVTTIEPTTEIVETTTPTTTTTTTTTTTPAPTTTTTTTTTEAPVTGRGRFKGRGNRKTTHASISTTESSLAAAASDTTKPKSKFNRPSFGGRPRPGARTTPAPEEEAAAVKEESKPVSNSRPTLSRGRFGAGSTRSRTRTTSSTTAEASEESSTTASRPSSLTRPRSSFNLRTRGRTTAAPATEESEIGESSHAEVSSTTARTRKIQTGSAVRPLRPGPRINLTRGRPGQSTTTSTTEEPAEDHVTGDDADAANSNTSETSEDKEAETSAAPVDNSPLGRLKNKHRVNVQPRPKAAASAPVQVRRVNPLIARRRPAQTSESSSSSSSSSEAPESSTEAASLVQEESENTEDPSSVSSSTTTEEPKGLNKLLAGRRRLAVRQRTKADD